MEVLKMIVRRAASGIGVLVLGLALAMAPVMASPVGATKTKHHKTSKPKATASPKVSPGGCTALNTEQTQSSKLATTLEQAFASGNFATIKSAMLAEFNDLNTDVAKAGAVLSSAPANVKAAFATIGQAFTQLKTAIANSTSLTQLESSFQALGTNTKFTAAGQVLASYFGSKCGSTTPAT
jgi:hypothetical protein